MLQGIDVSGWQKSGTLKAKNYNFAIIKASEGVDYKSDGLDYHYNDFSGRTDGNPCGKLYGFYHYARPDTGNTAKAEAESFLKFVGHHKGKAVYALDWEDKALNYPASWAMEFLDIVSRETGCNPLFYASASVMRDPKYKDIVSKYPLWVAAYSDTPPDFGGAFKSWKIWQYTSEPYDLNKFNGNAEDWKALCCKAQKSKSWQVVRQGNGEIVLGWK